MCGKGVIMMMMRDHLETRGSSSGGGIPIKGKEQPRRSGSQRRWHRCARRHGHRVRRGHHQHQQHQHQHHRRVQSRPGLGGVSLRPANIKGNRAPGMRAPRNTNQFLMHEKYQLLHMRSDSVGTDSGSDGEPDSTDMDAYLGELENARGALLDGLDLPSPPTARCIALLSFAQADQEESMQYFPSESDVLQSEDFMRRDFHAFCDAVAPCV